MASGWSAVVIGTGLRVPKVRCRVGRGWGWVGLVLVVGQNKGDGRASLVRMVQE